MQKNIFQKEENTVRKEDDKDIDTTWDRYYGVVTEKKGVCDKPNQHYAALFNMKEERSVTITERPQIEMKVFEKVDLSRNREEAEKQKFSQCHRSATLLALFTINSFVPSLFLQTHLKSHFPPKKFYHCS